MEVMVERWNELYDQFIDEIEAGRTVGFASRIDAAPAQDRQLGERPAHLLITSAGETLGSLGHPDLDGEVLQEIAAAWPGPYVRRHAYALGEVLIEVVPPPPVLLIFGATDIGIALSRIAQVCGLEVIVSDPRRTFAREERFPGATLHLGWPNELEGRLSSDSQVMGPNWAVIVLFHDPKIDLPALTLALRSEAFYIGLLGSRKTQADRRADLIEAGFEPRDLARIHGPAGLDITSRDLPEGKSPALIALSMMAEVIAVRHKRNLQPAGKMGR
jgi:xanthine dehydrogenase accessory factor